jgi:hypothetical protein
MMGKVSENARATEQISRAAFAAVADGILMFFVIMK